LGKRSNTEDDDNFAGPLKRTRIDNGGDFERTNTCTFWRPRTVAVLPPDCYPTPTTEQDIDAGEDERSLRDASLFTSASFGSTPFTPYEGSGWEDDEAPVKGDRPQNPMPDLMQGLMQDQPQDDQPRDDQDRPQEDQPRDDQDQAQDDQAQDDQAQDDQAQNDQAQDDQAQDDQAQNDQAQDDQAQDDQAQDDQAQDDQAQDDETGKLSFDDSVAKKARCGWCLRFLQDIWDILWALRHLREESTNTKQTDTLMELWRKSANSFSKKGEEHRRHGNYSKLGEKFCRMQMARVYDTAKAVMPSMNSNGKIQQAPKAKKAKKETNDSFIRRAFPGAFTDEELGTINQDEATKRNRRVRAEKKLYKQLEEGRCHLKLVRRFGCGALLAFPGLSLSTDE
jgi:hypothetical protein